MKRLKRPSSEKHKKQLKGYLPNDVWINILKRLPLKSLLRLQCVVKSWKSLITDPSFKLRSDSTNSYSILGYYKPNCDRYRLKFHRCNQSDANDNVDDIDDHLTKLHKFNACQVMGSSNGLICFTPEDEQLRDPEFPLEECTPLAMHIYLWNPGIKRYKKVPSLCHPKDASAKFGSQSHKRIGQIGFGFCGINGFNDYKLVHICLHESEHSSVAPSSYCHGHVNVYSLAYDSWKSIPYANVKAYYWLVNHYDDLDERSRRYDYSLVAFDLVNETFIGIVKLPRLARHSDINMLCLFELNGSLAVYEATDVFCGGCLWVFMNKSNDNEDGEKGTWIKLFSIMADDIQELVMDHRLPYSLQRMLQHEEDLYRYELCFYFKKLTSYEGTYVKSLALLGVASSGTNGLPFIKDDELDPEDDGLSWLER